MTLIFSQEYLALQNPEIIEMAFRVLRMKKEARKREKLGEIFQVPLSRNRDAG